VNGVAEKLPELPRLPKIAEIEALELQEFWGTPTGLLFNFGNYPMLAILAISVRGG
jgi:hypothetical protein